jgi:FkbM family methyltransferase
MRIGPIGAKTHLLVDRAAARAQMNEVQRLLSNYLAAEQVGWLLRKFDVNCVLDVGANVGQYARSLRRAGYTGRIVSFEPVADLANRLRAEAADDPAWVVYQCALGDTECTAEINVAHGSEHAPGKMSSLLPSSEFGMGWSAKLRDMPTEQIIVRRLDSLYDEAVAGIDTPRVFLKMDTQGYDLRTFRGAGDHAEDLVGLQSEVSCIQIYERMPRLVEQLDAYEEAGFAPAGMFQVSRHLQSLRIIEFDLVMVRVDAVGYSQTR